MTVLGMALRSGSQLVYDFSINDILLPQILKVQTDYIIVFKPPQMHSAPLKNQNAETLLDFCCRKFPEIKNISGRKEEEGGLLHRLDYGTHGLLLLARTQKGIESLLSQQNNGEIEKKYTAQVIKSEIKLPGFPANAPLLYVENLIMPLEINSAFRPFGIGRKSVRPVFDGEKQYTTEILEVTKLKNNVLSLRIRIKNGFRHQIRCHLAWMGFPIINDSLYGGLTFVDGKLGLEADSISFHDPSTGERLTFRISAAK